MQYKLIGTGNVDDVINTIIQNRGIKDPYRYLNLTDKDTCNWQDLDNINDAIRCFVGHFERGDDIAVLVDSDP